jgi:ElaB/YqjD/DUF883 family membrane-anchored ribosome-binding protein
MTTDRILSELAILATDFDEQARDRAREGMDASADAYRDCRDAVRQLARWIKAEADDEH